MKQPSVSMLLALCISSVVHVLTNAITYNEHGDELDIVLEGLDIAIKNIEHYRTKIKETTTRGQRS